MADAPEEDTRMRCGDHEQPSRRAAPASGGITPDPIEEVTVAAYEPGKAPPHVFLGSWDGEESELVVGEGQELRLTAGGQLPEKMPPHIRHYILRLSGSDH
ncbi:hypothetical protein ACWD4G_14660 [Streptomyces sp. NPDC002643]